MIIMPVYIPHHDYDSSPRYRYKEKRVTSSYRDRVYIRYTLDMVEHNKKPWYKRLFSLLPDEVVFYIRVNRTYSKDIVWNLRSGTDFLTVYKNYKNKANISDKSDYDGLFENFSEMDLNEIGEILRKGYKVSCVVSEPVTWYERDYSEREVFD